MSAFLVLSLLYAAIRPAHSTVEWLMWGSLAARILYTVFYARAMQPHRTISYTVGALLMFTMAVLTMRSTFQVQGFRK